MDIITVLTSIVTCLIAIVGYFIKSHIENIQKDVKQLKSQVSEIKQDSIWLSGAIKDLKSSSNTASKELQISVGRIFAQVDEVKEKFDLVNDKLKSHEKHLENYGQVIRFLVNKDKKQ